MFLHVLTLKKLFRIQRSLPVCLLLPEEKNIKLEVLGKCYVFPLKNTQFTKKRNVKETTDSLELTGRLLVQCLELEEVYSFFLVCT